MPLTNESLATHRALEGLFASVGPFMFIQMTFLAKVIAAIFTLMGFLSRVHYLMSLEFRFVYKPFVAEFTPMFLLLFWVGHSQ